MIFVNFKTYPSGTGSRAVELARICAEVSEDVPVIPVVQVVDLFRAGQVIGGRGIWVQHVDGVSYGQNTGWTLPEAVKEAGAMGTFLNHSEHKIIGNTGRDGGKGMFGRTIIRCREAGLATMVFAEDLEELGLVLQLKPDWVAYEPPELVGSMTDSVANKPEIVKEAVVLADKFGIPLVIGAGVKSAEDIRFALENGARAVAVARFILEAEDPRKELRKLLDGFVKQ